MSGFVACGCALQCSICARLREPTGGSRQRLEKHDDWKNMTTLVSPLERLAPVILSPLVVSHRLIDLAEDVGHAGYAAIAEELIELAYRVLDAGCRSAR
jgi:hypothetical protein